MATNDNDFTAITRAVNHRTARAIRAVQRYRGASDAALAEWVGISPQRLAPYLKGRSKIHVGILHRIADVLGVDVGALMSENPDDAVRWCIDNEPNSTWCAPSDSNRQPAGFGKVLVNA